MRPPKQIAKLQLASFNPPRYCEDCGKSLIADIHMHESHYYCMNCCLKRQKQTADLQRIQTTGKLA